MSKKIILVDTDPGVDDCAALMMLLSQPHDVKIVGVTCAAGNVGLQRIMINAVRIVKLFDKLDEVPVFGGCGQPMVAMPHAEDAAYYHGVDGLGDAPLVYPERTDSLIDHVQAEHAVNAMIRLSKEYDGQIQLLCLGPLTNPAMAAKLDPNFPKRLKSLHILGGTIKGYGNVSPCAEYNFFADPEAAYNVCRSFPQFCPTDIYPYESIFSHGIPPKKYDEMASGSGLRKEFFRAIFAGTRVCEDNLVARGINSGYCLCDTYLVATVLDPNIVTKAKYARVAVELGGHIARGSFIIDHKNKGSPHLSQSDVRIIEEIDDTIYLKLFSKIFDE